MADLHAFVYNAAMKFIYILALTFLLSACSSSESSGPYIPEDYKYESMYERNLRLCQESGMSYVDCQVQEYHRSLANDKIYERSGGGGDDI